MVLKTYKAARTRFTWRNRHVDNDDALPKIMAKSKNQSDYGRDNCTYVGLCSAMESHLRMRKYESRELSPRDLEEKVLAVSKIGQMKSKGRVTRCFHVLRSEGVAFEGSQETCKVESYRAHYLMTRDHAACAVNDYLRYGPMVGVFKVRGGDLEIYGLSSGYDAIHFVTQFDESSGHAMHLVTISGFGLQAMCPFWEFQNTYGPDWRGSARGYGRLYALHLTELWGFTLAS